MELSKTKISNPNLIREFDKRIECIRRTYNDAQLQALLKTLDQSLFLVQQKETLPPPRPPPPPSPAPSRDAYFYLYVQRNERLCRLNVTKLSEAPVFELVCNFGPSHRRAPLSPVVCFNAESHLFMVGDVFFHLDQMPKTSKPFFEVFSVDTDKSPSFLPCPPTIAPGLTAQKVYPIVVPLHGKIYVLALHLYPGQPCFEVYDNGKWETLPPPPYFPCVETEEDGLWGFNTRLIFHALYAWGNKIVVCLEEGTFCFDTETVKWIDMQNIDMEFEELSVLQCVAEYLSCS